MAEMLRALGLMSGTSADGVDAAPRDTQVADPEHCVPGRRLGVVRPFDAEHRPPDHHPGAGDLSEQARPASRPEARNYAGVELHRSYQSRAHYLEADEKNKKG